ncbi:exocyst complex component Sec15p [Trichomonascus vanleenenianus]|uniref:Rab GTPase-binding exocyst subunit SEC15 n=1 Tax=Trichomonascus vanleenenianus TaxID=2268995 RepID=UPI003ECB78FE
MAAAAVVPQGPEEAESDSLRDMSLQLEQLLSSDPVLHTKKGGLDTTDDYLEQLAPILKDALENDTTEELLLKCEAFKKDRDREIDEICSGNHNEYMASVEQMGQVTAEAQNIRESAKTIGKQLQSTGEILADKKNALIEARRVRKNVDSAIEAVTACLQVLDLTNNVHELLQEKRKFAALKSLDDLQNVHLKEVSQYAFAQLINRSVPALTKMVRRDTITDIEVWLQETQQLKTQIGHKAFSAIEKQRREWKAVVEKNPHLKRYKFNSQVEKSYRETGVDHLSELASEVMSIDFSHLYECVLVHSSMGRLEEFQHHFETDRKIQRDYLVPQSLSLQNSEGVDDLNEFSSVLQSIAGVCIIDRQISRNIPTLRPVKEVEDIWDSLSTNIISFLTNELKSAREIDTIKKLKDLMGTFLHTMQNAGFNVSGIQSLLVTLFKGYSSFLRSNFADEFARIVISDNYMPMLVSTQKVYDGILDNCWYTPSPEELAKQFPRTFPFSKTYPLVCLNLRTFIESHNKFLDDLQYDPVLVEDIIRNAVDDLLVDVVCRTFDERLQASTREQIVQILVNLDYFVDAARGIEELLYGQRISGRKAKLTLKATQELQETRKRAEARVYELVNTNVDSFLDLADYDWHTTHVNVEPSTFLFDMVSFLKTLVTSTLGNLPSSVKSLIYFNAFDHLAMSMLKFLTSASDRMTFEAVENFDLDIRYLEQFVDQIAEDANDMSLTTTFTELRQCINLIQSDDVNEYIDPHIRLRKYDRVTKETAQLLFQKIQYARQLRQLQHERSASGDNQRLSQGSNPPGHSSPSSRMMQFYRSSVEKLNDKNRNSHG